MDNFKNNDLVISLYKNGIMRPMIIMDNTIKMSEYNKLAVLARGIGMRIDYPEPIEGIIENCGQITFLEFYNIVEEKYPQHSKAILGELENQISYINYDREISYGETGKNNREIYFSKMKHFPLSMDKIQVYND